MAQIAILDTLYKCFFENWKIGIKAVFYILLATIISLIFPLFPKWAIDTIVMRNKTEYLLPLSIVFLSLVIINQILRYFYAIGFYSFQKSTILGIQRRLINSIFDYPLEFFDKSHSGYLLGRIQSDVNGISYFLSDNIVQIIMDCFKVIATVFILFSLNPILALVTIVMIPFIILSIISTKNNVKKVNIAHLEGNALLQKEISDNFQGIEGFKSLSEERHGAERIYTALEKYQSIEISRNKIVNLNKNLIELLSYLAEVLVFFLGLKMLISGKITIGGFTAFLGYIVFIYVPLTNVSLLFISMDYARRGYKRVKDLFDILPESNGTNTIDIIESVELCNICFSYDNEKSILNNISFKIKKGERILIKGNSGSGKTTLIKVLMGLYQPSHGKVLLNGKDLKTLDKKNIRSKIGYVSQSVFLLNKSLRENIVLNNCNTSDEYLINLLNKCKMGKIKSDDKNWQEALNMIISEKGNNFSGGERQRIALIRALVKDPDLLILDESTANLDDETEMTINGLVNNYSDRLIIKISHKKHDEEGWKVIDLSR